MEVHEPEILLASYDPITRKVIDSSPRLKLAVMRRIPQAHHDLKMGLHTAEEKPVQDPKAGLRRDVNWALGKDTPYVRIWMPRSRIYL